MILEAKRIIKPYTFPAVPSFPSIFPVAPSWGLSVGCLTDVDLDSSDGKRCSYTAFSPASISIMSNDLGVFFTLSGGLIQKGSSGGPVFTPDASLVGVISGTMRFSLNAGHHVPVVPILPVMSALWTIRDAVAKFFHG